MKEIIIKLPDDMELSLHELYERLYERIYEDTNAVSTENIVAFKASSFINMCEQVFELEKELKHKRTELEECKNELNICKVEIDAAVNDLEYISSCKTCEFGCNGEYDDDSYECFECDYMNDNKFVWRGVCPANSSKEE